MRINIVEDAQCSQIEVTLRCPHVDREVLDAVARLRIVEQKLTGEHDGEICVVSARDVLYIESVDKRTFFYTQQRAFESRLKLFEMEELLREADFVRTGKSCLINFTKVVSIRPDVGGRLLLTLEGGDRVRVSRQYAPEIKRKLGLAR